MTKTYPDADAVGVAVSALLPGDSRRLSAVEQEDGSFVVDGPADILAMLDAGPSKDRLKAYAADKRWQVENGGTTIAGIRIATDDRSKTMIVGARLAAGANASWSTTWIGADGVPHAVDAATMIAISDAVQAHVNTAFAIFGALLTNIEAGTVTSLAEIDAAGWPS